MGKPIEARQPSPELFFATVNAYQRPAALKAAIELDIFTAIAAGADTPQALAARCGAAERGARTLCDYLVVLGFLTKDGGRYGLTDDSAVFLNRASSAYLGGAIKFLLSPMYAEDALFRKTAESRSEEHTSELQSRLQLECRLLLEK